MRGAVQEGAAGLECAGQMCERQRINKKEVMNAGVQGIIIIAWRSGSTLPSPPPRLLSSEVDAAYKKQKSPRRTCHGHY